MKREGRMHGSYVRVRKQSAEWVKAPSKPTNHSRSTGRCMQNKTRCSMCCAGHPAQKALCKSKGEHKSRDQDLVNNAKLHEWRLCYAYPSCPFADNAEAGGEDLDLDFEHLSDCEAEAPSEDEETKENARRQEELSVPLDSFLRSRRRWRRLPPVREVPNEEEGIRSNDDESGSESDWSWAGVDITDVERAGADLDEWLVVG